MKLSESVYLVLVGVILLVGWSRAEEPTATEVAAAEAAAEAVASAAAKPTEEAVASAVAEPEAEVTSEAEKTAEADVRAAVIESEATEEGGPQVKSEAKKGGKGDESGKLLGFGGIKAGPTVITAERIEFDYKEMVAVFDEDVNVKNEQFVMLADRVLVFLEGTNDVRQLLAMGHVALTNENRSAVCDRAVYTRATQQIVLTGDAKLQREGDSVSGDRITIWLNDERMEVSPGTFVISPGTIKERDQLGGSRKREVETPAVEGQEKELKQDDE